MSKRTRNILSGIFLTLYFLGASSSSAVSKGTIVGGENFSPRELDKEQVTRLSDLPPQAQDKISQHLKEAEYEVSRHERMLPSGKASAYRAFNRTQNLNAYFNEEGVNLLPKGKGEPSLAS